MMVYEYLKEKWEKRDKLEQARRKRSMFASNETLEQVNEKARLRGMTYGRYVNEREQGLHEEDYGTVVKLEHPHRLAFCKVRKHTTVSAN